MPRHAARRGRRARLRRRPLVRTPLVLVAAALGVAVAGPAATDDDGDRALYDRGAEVFQATCAACHGTRGEGGPGPGVLAGPPIVDVDVSYVDLTVRTGRMPIAEPRVGVYTDRLDDVDREALVHYTRERFELPGEIPTLGEGDPARGQELFVRNCAACHGAAGDGGISGGAVRVPALAGLDGVAVAQATRVGPFEMPAFASGVLSDEDIDHLVGYLEVVEATPRTVAGVRKVDQVGAALFAVGLGIAALVVLLVVAHARRWHHRDPEGAGSRPPFEPRP